MSLLRLCIVTLVLLSRVEFASANEVLLDEDGDPMDADASGEGQLMTTHRRLYDAPSWWDYIVGNFDDIDDEGPLKRCFKRTEPPVDGSRCARLPKTCYFGDGTRECPGVGPFPDVRCHCDGAAGSRRWNCAPAACPVQEKTCCAGEAFGDPHYVSFGGISFDYHGECDLVLMKSSILDVDLHIRTLQTSNPPFAFAEIVGMALRIGTDIFEIDDATLLGGTKTYYLNGVDLLGVLPSALGGRTLSAISDGVKVDFGSGQYMNLRFVNNGRGSIQIYGCNDFADTTGFLGPWCDQQSADILGRDGMTSFLSQIDTVSWTSQLNYSVASDTYGQEWQVGPTDPPLFRNSTSPNQCVTRRRRLQSTVPTDAEIQAAIVLCAGIFNQAKFKECIFDVVSSGDDSWATDITYNEIIRDDGTIIKGPGADPIISGIILEDINNDDIGEDAVASVVLVLLEERGIVVGTTSTDSLGQFSFDGFRRGRYRTVFSDPNFISISDIDGGNPTATTVDTTLGAVTNLVFVVENAYPTISGVVLEDINNDNIGDDAVGSVVLFLLDERGGVVGTTSTDSLGQFSFDGFPRGRTFAAFSDRNFMSISDTDGGDPTKTAVDTTVGAVTNLVFVVEKPQ